MMKDKENDHLTVLTVQEDFTPTVGAPPYTDLSYVAEANEASHKHCQQLLKSYGKWSKDHNIHCTLLLGHGPANQVIVDEVKERKIDVLVIGRADKSAFKRFFVGSHSKYAVEHTECTVIVVNEKPKKDE